MGERGVRTYSHGESTAKVIQNDPGTWVPTVIHGHFVLRREEAVEKMWSKGPGEALNGHARGLGEARWMRECRRQRGAQKVESVDVVESLTGG